MLKLLFICTHNRCRSILAEAIANHHGCDLIRARSAGTEPAGEVHPLTLQYLADFGIPTRRLHSKSLDEVRDFEPDVVITVCDSAAAEACPVWIGNAHRVHWGLGDPSAVGGSPEVQRRAFRDTIETLRDRITLLRHWVGADATPEQLQARLANLGVPVRSGEWGALRTEPRF